MKTLVEFVVKQTEKASTVKTTSNPFTKMMWNFIQEPYNKKLIERMCNYFTQDNNLNELIRIAHKIKGALAIMGVTYLDEILIHFEEGENISLSEFDTFIQSYIFTCNEIHKELDLVVNEYKSLVL